MTTSPTTTTTTTTTAPAFRHSLHTRLPSFTVATAVRTYRISHINTNRSSSSSSSSSSGSSSRGGKDGHHVHLHSWHVPSLGNQSTLFSPRSLHQLTLHLRPHRQCDHPLLVRLGRRRPGLHSRRDCQSLRMGSVPGGGACGRTQIPPQACEY